MHPNRYCEVTRILAKKERNRETCGHTWKETKNVKARNMVEDINMKKE